MATSILLIASAAVVERAGPWGADGVAGRAPGTWGVVRKLCGAGVAGILVPGFANGATEDDQNLVLWRWGPDLPHRVTVFDPTGKLPKNQLSWR